ncbi:unnamed protein product [Spirodela intermedia]|uniref:Uncharacterized protein n=1 Tax=Spirodela intermedia TaxID=51605 RepID=A0A7I8IA15_SPIIN|nr:unnamed protein product [Spirodela intermedia]CAA6654368.1 unnamed protein product [Spirodela intermedia]
MECTSRPCAAAEALDFAGITSRSGGEGAGSAAETISITGFGTVNELATAALSCLLIRK